MTLLSFVPCILACRYAFRCILSFGYLLICILLPRQALINMQNCSRQECNFHYVIYEIILQIEFFHIYIKECLVIDDK